MTLPTLPCRPTPEQRAEYVTRVVAAYSRATPEQVATGTDWYPAAHRIALEYARGARAGAGIIAALSANKSWPENVRLARDAFRGEFAGHFADALDKCREIHAGVDPSDVLPMASKTGQFFLCIADPSDPEAVVVDRHAHDIVAGTRYGNGERGLSTPSRYASIADAYREAGKALGVVASVAQAVTWTWVTDMSRYSRTLTGVAGGLEGDE